MLNFVDITVETAFQDREFISDVFFGLQIANPEFPLDFQYQASEAVTSFSAIRKDITGTIIETISLSTSLITYDSVNNIHICNGLLDYVTHLECGYYHFLVNSKFQSEDFNVNIELEEVSINTNSIISISGLEFYDSNYDIPDYLKEGAPEITFASEFGTNLEPLPFQYRAFEVVSSFDLVKMSRDGTIISTTSLSTALITYDSVNGIHMCDGLTAYTDVVLCGLYYFSVNNRYVSKVFEIFELLCPIIDDIVVSNAISGSTADLDYNAYVTGTYTAVTVELTYIFSSAIDTFSESVILTPVTQSFSTTFAIPAGVSGNCTLTILNNACATAYTHEFVIALGMGIGHDIIGDTLVVY